MRPRNSLLVRRLPLIALLTLAACAPASGDDLHEGNGPAGAGGSGPDSGAGGSGGSGLGGSGGGLGDASLDIGSNDASDDSACAAITEKAQGKPVDLFILFDKSASMAQPTGMPKWASAKAGLTAFLNDPLSTGIDVALKFFPITGVTQCNPLPNVYATLDVPLGPLPMHAMDLVNAFPAQPDGSTTPMYPALAGILNSALQSAQANPTHTSAVLFVTDGVPDGPAKCNGVTDPTDPVVLADLVHNGAIASPHVLTFVVGLPGAAFPTLDQIAAAGGTGQSIRLTDSQTVQAEFQKALAQVRGNTLPCEYPIPSKVENGTVDPGLVNVVYTPGGSSTGTTVPQSSTDCAGDGWMYDDPQHPTKITLCPSTCTEVRSDYAGPQIDIQLGCRTIIH